MKSKYQREWEIQERRYQRAERKAKRHIALAGKHNRLTDAWIKIMEDAVDKQERLTREEAATE